MKHYQYLYLLLLSTQSLLAQITIDHNDMPRVDDIYRIIEADTTGMTVPATGTNFSWDYKNLSEVQERMDTFKNVSATPVGYQLYFNNEIMYPEHKASYALAVESPIDVSQFQVKDAYLYYRNETGVFKEVGIGAKINNIPSSIRYEDIDSVYVFPMTMGNVDSATAFFFHTIAGLGSFGQNRKRINTVDGWGTLETPFGTFDVIRVKTTLDATDTVYIDAISTGFTVPHPLITEYKWLAKGYGQPILNIRTNRVQGNEHILTVSYMDSMPATGTQAGTLPALSVWQVYPNPAKNNFVLDLGQQRLEPLLANLINPMGQVVRSLRQPQGQQQWIVFTAGLPEGIYLLHLQTKAGSAYRKIMISGN